MSNSITNPRPFLNSLVGKQVIVRLKWGKAEYKGRLLATDSYMNLQLDDTLETMYDRYNTEKVISSANIGEILIRCNNVLFIRGVNETENETIINNGNGEVENGDHQNEDVVIEE